MAAPAPAAQDSRQTTRPRPPSQSTLHDAIPSPVSLTQLASSVRALLSDGSHRRPAGLAAGLLFPYRQLILERRISSIGRGYGEACATFLKVFLSTLTGV